MKIPPQTYRHLLAVLVAALFFFGCIVGSQRSAKTLQPGQASLGAGLSHVISTESGEDDPFDLIDANIQLGIAKGVDLGIRHTFDATNDEAAYSTFWGDAKFQVNNLANELNTPTFAVGLSKGYVYHEDAQLHITSIPITASMDISKRNTLYAQYRHELISEEFVPTESESFSNPRNVFMVGAEFAFTDPDPSKWIPKLNLGIGFQNDLAGGDFEINSVSFNVGLWFDSPFSVK